MINNFDITSIESAFSNAVRALGFDRVWNNRPKAISDDISDFVVVRVSGGITDRAAYGDCRVMVYLYARDVKEMKNAKKLSVMHQKLRELPSWIEPLLINPHPRVIGDTADDFGFHTRIINFKVFIKAQ